MLKKTEVKKIYTEILFRYTIVTIFSTNVTTYQHAW